MFWKNLNMFLAGSLVLNLATGGMVASTIAMPLTLLAHHLGFRDAVWLFMVGYLAIPLGLAVVWIVRGLSPEYRNPERERRYTIGHRLMLVANLVLLLAGLVPLLLVWLTGQQDFMYLMWFAVILIPPAVVAGGVGFYMVWSSRA